MSIRIDIIIMMVKENLIDNNKHLTKLLNVLFTLCSYLVSVINSNDLQIVPSLIRLL